MSTENNYRMIVVDDIASIHQDFRKILLPEQKSSSQSIDKMNELLSVRITEKNKLPPFEIDSAYQGQEAIEYVQKAVEEKRPYAIAFVDVLMPPGEDGVETIAKMWKVDPNIQIVICTAYTKYSWEDLLKRFGETDRLLVLKKPFDNIEVIQLAIALTKKWNLNQSIKNYTHTSSKEDEIKNSIDNLKEKIAALDLINQKLKRQNLLYKEKKTKI